VIATRDFAEFYFDNDTGLPLTLCSRLTGLHAQPAGAGKPSAIYAGSEAVTRGCGTLGGDYSAALAFGFAGFRDWAHAAPAQSIFRLHAVPSGKRVHGRPPHASYPMPASKQEMQASNFPHHRPRKALKHPGTGTDDGVR
jgi:hypothetical protein